MACCRSAIGCCDRCWARTDPLPRGRPMNNVEQIANNYMLYFLVPGWIIPSLGSRTTSATGGRGSRRRAGCGKLSSTT